MPTVITLKNDSTISIGEHLIVINEDGTAKLWDAGIEIKVSCDGESLAQIGGQASSVGIMDLLGDIPGISGLKEIADLPSSLASILGLLTKLPGTLSGAAKDSISTAVKGVADTLLEVSVAAPESQDEGA